MACELGPRQTWSRQCAKFFDLVVDVKGLVEYGGQAQPASNFQTGPSQRFVIATDGDSKQSLLQTLSRAAKTKVGAGSTLQFERNVFQNVGQVGSAPQPLKKPAPLADAAAMFNHLRQPAHDAIVEAGYLVRGRILQIAQIHPGFEHGRLGPDVRPLQSQDFAKFHIRGCVRDVAGNRQLPVNVEDVAARAGGVRVVELTIRGCT